MVRIWNKGSEEPPSNIDRLVDPLGYEMVRDADDLWHYADSPEGFPWSDLDDEFDIDWPLIESSATVSPELLAVWLTGWLGPKNERRLAEDLCRHFHLIPKPGTELAEYLASRTAAS